MTKATTGNVFSMVTLFKKVVGTRCTVSLLLLLLHALHFY